MARSIGVSDISAAELYAVIDAGTVPPAVNQVQFDPRHTRRALLAACGRHNVAVEAYSPLGTGRYVADAAVAKIARQTGRTPAQVLMRDFALSAGEMAELDALGATDHFAAGHRPGTTGRTTKCP